MEIAVWWDVSQENHEPLQVFQNPDQVLEAGPSADGSVEQQRPRTNVIEPPVSAGLNPRKVVDTKGGLSFEREVDRLADRLLKRKPDLTEGDGVLHQVRRREPSKSSTGCSSIELVAGRITEPEPRDTTWCHRGTGRRYSHSTEPVDTRSDPRRPGRPGTSSRPPSTPQWFRMLELPDRDPRWCPRDHSRQRPSRRRFAGAGDTAGFTSSSGRGAGNEKREKLGRRTAEHRQERNGVNGPGGWIMSRTRCRHCRCRARTGPSR